MKEGEIVGDLLLPPDEDAAEAIEPRMSALHGPAPGAIAGRWTKVRRVLALDANMGGVTIGADTVAHRVIVIAFVHRQVLSAFGRGLGALERLRLQRGLDQLHVGAIGAVDGQANG
jgi:hypothetical protein